MAKRNCRRTANEREVHDRAVKMKRMTDGLTVRVHRHTDRGSRKGRVPEGIQRRMRVCDSSQEEQRDGVHHPAQGEKVRGIGAITINKLMEKANEYGYC